MFILEHPWVFMFSIMAGVYTLQSMRAAALVAKGAKGVFIVNWLCSTLLFIVPPFQRRHFFSILVGYYAAMVFGGVYRELALKLEKDKTFEVVEPKNLETYAVKCTPEEYKILVEFVIPYIVEPLDHYAKQEDEFTKVFNEVILHLSGVIENDPSGFIPTIERQWTTWTKRNNVPNDKLTLVRTLNIYKNPVALPVHF